MYEYKYAAELVERRRCEFGESFLSASADGTADCVYRQWFLEVFLGPFSNVNDRIMPMSDARPEDHGHPTKAFCLVPYRDFSESFDDVMHCR